MKSSLLLAFLGLLISTRLLAQPTAFQPRGVGGGGALFFPRVNPANDDEFYVACDLSAMFHTTDFGQSYDQLDFQQLPARNVSTYEFTNNAAIAYSNYNDGNDGYPVRTLDGGANWSPLPGHDAGTGPVYRLFANYAQPNQLLLNYYGEIYISHDHGNTLQLVRQAADNGAGLILGGVWFDGNNLYLGTNEGVLVSANAGASFAWLPSTGLPAGEVIWSFAAAKNGATTRFVCITAAAGDTYNGLMPWEYYGLARGVYTMDNVSGNWQSKAAGIDFDNDFVMYAAMAWNDVNTIYLGGHDAALGAPLVFRTTNAGASWEKVFQSAGNANIATGWSGTGGDKGWGWGETCFGISVAPLNADKVLFSDYGFVHVSSNGGNSWRQAYVDPADQHPAGSPTPKQDAYHSIGLENTTAWQVHWQNPSTLLAAFSDIGLIRSTDAGNTWGFSYTGLSVNSTYRLAKSPSGVLFAATSGVHDMYQSTRLRDALLDAPDASGKIYYSGGDGGAWYVLHTFNHPVYWLALDPNQPNRMYASVIHFGGGGAGMQGGIWRTDNLNALTGSTWTQLPAPPRTEGHPAAIQVLNDGRVVCTFSGRINGAGQFTASSGVFLYNPATNSWTDASDPQMHYWTKDIVIDPADPAQNTWYAGVFSGWGGAPSGKGGLYRTTNRGASWTKLTGAQFDRVTSLTFHPQNANQGYLTTETQGLWVSDNLSTPTPDWTLVESYDYRQPERVFFNPFNGNEMWVSSFGNGLKVGALAPTNTTSVLHQADAMTVSPNPAGETVQINLPPNAVGHQMLTISDALGQVRWQSPSPNRGPAFTVNIADWPAGLYVVKWGQQAARFLKKS